MPSIDQLKRLAALRGQLQIETAELAQLQHQLNLLLNAKHRVEDKIRSLRSEHEALQREVQPIRKITPTKGKAKRGGKECFASLNLSPSSQETLQRLLQKGA